MADATLNRFLARGTNAQRVAFTPAPPTPASGPSPTYFWFETDTGNSYAWSGSAWVQQNVVANGSIGTAKLGGDITTAGKALLDDADAAAQRTTLGLGTAATQNSTAFAAASHTHAIADVTGLSAALLAVEAWTPNFSSAGEVRIYAREAMTITQIATSGTGTIAYEKSTAAAPGTFASTTSPITLEAGAWLKVSASAVTSIVAVNLRRTA